MLSVLILPLAGFALLGDTEDMATPQEGEVPDGPGATTSGEL